MSRQLPALSNDIKIAFLLINRPQLGTAPQIILVSRRQLHYGLNLIPQFPLCQILYLYGNHILFIQVGTGGHLDDNQRFFSHIGNLMGHTGRNGNHRCTLCTISFCLPVNGNAGSSLNQRP